MAQYVPAQAPIRDFCRHAHCVIYQYAMAHKNVSVYKTGSTKTAYWLLMCFLPSLICCKEIERVCVCVFVTTRGTGGGRDPRRLGDGKLYNVTTRGIGGGPDRGGWGGAIPNVTPSPPESELRSCVKVRWTYWAPVPNKPTVSVDVKQHFKFTHQRYWRGPRSWLEWKGDNESGSKQRLVKD